MSRTTPFYRYDPNLGSPRDKYSRAHIVHPEAGQPEVPGIFVANVEGETIINTMNGQRTLAWQAKPGTQCMILGYWADGTVHLQWAAIDGNYRVDGRFPAWVVAPDPNAKMAGGGRILIANNPPLGARGIPSGAGRLALVLGLVLVLLAVPPVHDGLGEFLSAILHTAR